MFFGDHRIPAGKNVKISVKTFFIFFIFWDHLISVGKNVRISVKTFLKRHFLRLFWSSQNRKSVIFELAPGPRSALGAPAGSPPNLQTTHEGNFCTCNRTLFSDYFDQSLTTRSPERGFSTNITPTLHLVQPHCASITKHRHHKWHHSSNLPQMQDSCVSNKNWTRQFTKNFGVSL